MLRRFHLSQDVEPPLVYQAGLLTSKCPIIPSPISTLLPSVLWHCWLGDRKGIWPVKKSCYSNCQKFIFGSGQKCNNLRKNRLVKQRQKAVVSPLLVLIKSTKSFIITFQFQILISTCLLGIIKKL